MGRVLDAPGARVAASLALAALFAGCSAVDRSRSLSDPAVPPKTIAQQVCSLCHGMDGNSTSPNFPRLAGQSAPYLAKQLRDFKGHNRLDPPGPEFMWGISRSLSDDQVRGLADYFSSQAVQPNNAGDPRLAAEGEKIYKNGIPSRNIPACATCHGAGGEGTADFPRLAGQHSPYVIRELQSFQRTGERPAPLMEGVSHDLSAENIAAVANFVQGMGRP